MKFRGPAIALVLILILAYAHQASIESNIISTPDEKVPALLREDNVRVLNWWEVPLRHYFVSFITLYSPFLIPIAGIATVLAGLSFGIRQIEKKNVLDNERREDFFRLITENPGITQPEFKNLTGVNRSSLRYHLKILIREEKIISIKIYKKRHYFENHNGGVSEAHLSKLILNCSTTKDIFGYIYNNPGCTQKDLADYTKLSYSTISWHIERLSSGNLVVSIKKDHYKHYYAEDCTVGFNLIQNRL